MTLSAIALTTVDRAKAHLGLSDASSSFRVDALDIYYDTNAGAGSTGTVEVRENTIIGLSTGGTGFSLDLTNVNYDTIGELVTAINAVAGWVATALTYSDAASADLIEAASQSCYGIALRKRLLIPNNRKIEYIIDGASAEIEKWLDRGILTRSYDELYDDDSGLSTDTVTLRQPNVTGVTSVFVAASLVMTVKYSGTSPRATVEVTDTGVVLRSRTGATTAITISTTTFVISPNLTQMAAAIGAVTGWSASVPSTVDGNDPSAYMLREGVRNAKSVDVGLHGWEDFTGDYTVDYAAGLIIFGRSRLWPTDWDEWTGVRRMRLIYTAGFATVPADVERVVLEMVSTEWSAAIADPLLQSESIGSYSYSMTAASISGTTPMAKSWQQRLWQYRRWLP